MIIDGRKLAQEIVEQIKLDIKPLFVRGITPKIGIITVGVDTVWKAYVGRKRKLAEELEIQTEMANVDEDEKTLLETIRKFNEDKSIHGFIVQRPFTNLINKDLIINAINPEKDIDGFRKDSPFEVPVWLAVERILKEISCLSRSHLDKGHTLAEWMKNKRVVVIGKGETGGKPSIEGLRKLGVNPHVVDSKTENKSEILRDADIIISATGKNRVVEAKDLKPGVILVGIGIHRDEDGKLRGDYDEKAIENIAGFYTPTPGGVGPLNLAFLFKNLIKAVELK